MGYAGGNNPIIKSNPAGWIIVLVSMVAAGAVILLMLGFFAGPGEDRPGWAPVGCTVMYTRGYNNSITIIVHDLEYFDTEPELASIIITAVDREEDYFNTQGNVYDPLEREVDIQFPRTEDGRIPILQYTGGRQPRMPQHQIRVVGVVEDEYRYLYRGLTRPEIVEIAEGERELGFLDWMPEAYGREGGMVGGGDR
jgi:hypothetical protein